MLHSRPGPDAGEDTNAGPAPDDSVNFSLVLVVGRSQINCVVVSKIVERSGLKAVSEIPDSAPQALAKLKPGVVILDGGADNCDCDAALAHIAERRRAFAGSVPCVILLSTRGVSSEQLPHGRSVDAIVAKPFTPESLQPVVDRLLRRARG
ncbi:response regulator [Mesorhizobium sp. L-8-10]|uniref:response regulator n=1 Tax=Mesorhizobium sp. L-8-10 TaxID=2744523 RepID=UPI0019370BD8|nr:response regulator [Mesorhizobium sp. L-8-10]BCH34632.1 response regulator [Mesorhizobium sp. L-8-10]